MGYLLHKLFGWEYWAFTWGYDTKVRRARSYKDGTKYVVCYGTHLVIGTDQYYRRNWRQVF